MAATTIRDRMARAGGPSLFRRLVIVAAVVAIAIVAYVLTNDGEEPGGEEAEIAGDTAADAADSAVDGQGAEPQGIGGETDPGLFADSPTPLEEGSSPNATSATPGDEMMDLPPDPPGGGRVDPDEDQAVAGEIVDEEVPDEVRESDVRTALPEDETGDGAGDESSGNEGEQTDPTTDATDDDAGGRGGDDDDEEEDDDEDEAGRQAQDE